jgi:DNA-binding response OmpR family regulator
MTLEDKGRVLVVEDETAVRSWLTIQLRRGGYQPFAAGTVQDARSLMLTTKPDVVILDLGLPDGSGLQFLDELRSEENSAKVPVVVLTGREPSEVKAPSLRGGAQIFLRKPARGVELLNAVAKLVARNERPVADLFEWQRGQRFGWRG